MSSSPQHDNTLAALYLLFLTTIIKYYYYYYYCVTVFGLFNAGARGTRGPMGMVCNNNIIMVVVNNWGVARPATVTHAHDRDAQAK